MIVKTAEFLVSNSYYQSCPKPDKPEYAFIGRSNVGKSSLINKMVGIKGLAKTSGKPGKTQLINHFLINEKWYLVDLPGYGYASIPLKIKAKWETMISGYLQTRKNLLTTFVLIDIRHSPQKNDIDFIENLAEHQIPFAIIFTKADKVTSRKQKVNLKTYEDYLRENWEELPAIFVTSSETGLGSEPVLDYIEQANKVFAYQTE
ncbi:MAG: ribosome biogenesis GTP-binding protein YihA/YsxC [Bacteroidales bacterium]|jgi:GTP-binding protein|nr:ribosome biogenesis GTP-binding protein YihA/YsxC [Bacteroidales bacterium]